MFSTPSLPAIASQRSLPWRPCLPGSAPRLISGLGRVAMVSLLVPFVVLIGLGTVAGLVVLSAARLLPPNPSSPRTAAVGREVAIHPRLTPDATDGRAAARAA